MLTESHMHVSFVNFQKIINIVFPTHAIQMLNTSICAFRFIQERGFLT